MLNHSASVQWGSACYGQSMTGHERRALVLLSSFSRREGRAWMSQSCAARTPPIWRRCWSTRCCVCATRCCRSAARARSAPICNTFPQLQCDSGLMHVPLWHLTWQECPVAAFSAAQQILLCAFAGVLWSRICTHCSRRCLQSSAALGCCQHLLRAGIRLLAQHGDGGGCTAAGGPHRELVLQLHLLLEGFIVRSELLYGRPEGSSTEECDKLWGGGLQVRPAGSENQGLKEK